MGARSFLPSRWTVTLLVAAMGFMQVCTGYARAGVGAPVASAAKSGHACCDTSQGEGCAAIPAGEPVDDSCSPACAAPRHAVMPESAVSPAGVLASACVAERGCFEFSDRSSSLTAAPVAISSTPLIYFLQRLLN